MRMVKVVHFVVRFPQTSVIHRGSLHRPPASLNSPDVYSFTPAKISPLGPQTVISNSRLVWQSSVQIYMRCLYYCIRLLACYVSRERALPGSVFQKLRVKVGRILQTEPLVSIYYSLIVRSMLLLDGLGFPWLSCYSSIGYPTPTITSDLKPIARSRDVEVVLAHSTYFQQNYSPSQHDTVHNVRRVYLLQNSLRRDWKFHWILFITYEI